MANALRSSSLRLLPRVRTTLQRNAAPSARIQPPMTCQFPARRHFLDDRQPWEVPPPRTAVEEFSLDVTAWFLVLTICFANGTIDPLPAADPNAKDEKDPSESNINDQKPNSTAKTSKAQDKKDHH